MTIVELLVEIARIVPFTVEMDGLASEFTVLASRPAEKGKPPWEYATLAVAAMVCTGVITIILSLIAS